MLDFFVNSETSIDINKQFIEGQKLKSVLIVLLLQLLVNCEITTLNIYERNKKKAEI